MTRSVLALLMGAVLVSTPRAQAPGRQLLILNPTADDVLNGVMMLQAEIRPASAGLVTFFVDGTRVCAASTVPYQCAWDSASMRGARDIRAVAELADGTRLVQTVRTRGTVAAFRASTDSVLVAVRVQDRNRRFVRGLGVDSFRLSEDGVPQTIATFATESSGGDVVLALDGSASMTPAVPELRAAARAFIAALPRNDMVTLAVFNSTLEVIAPRAADPVSRVAALDRLHAAGTTALYDVLIQAVDLFPSSSERRAIVMFTDGDDVASRASLASARRALQSANVVLYFVAQGKAFADRALRTQLATLATETGGAAFFASKMSDARGHFAAIAEELSNQYVIGYLPVRPFGDGAWREIRVDAADPSLRYEITARRGYLAARNVTAR
ncbi:MAG: VWA domain-containing protein [Acidobacteriota bacterium]